VVVAGARMRKTTTWVIPHLLSAPGPVYVTSNKRDVVDLTRAARNQRGTTWLYDPQAIAGGEPTWWWNPLDTGGRRGRGAVRSPDSSPRRHDRSAPPWTATLDPEGESLLAPACSGRPPRPPPPDRCLPLGDRPPRNHAGGAADRGGSRARGGRGPGGSSTNPTANGPASTARPRRWSPSWSTSAWARWCVAERTPARSSRPGLRHIHRHRLRPVEGRPGLGRSRSPRPSPPGSCRRPRRWRRAPPAAAWPPPS